MNKQQWESRVQHQVYCLRRLCNCGQGLQVCWCEGDDTGVLQDETTLYCS